MIHKLSEETPSIITLHIWRESLVRILCKGRHVWWKVMNRNSVFPDCGSNSQECKLQISSNSVNFLSWRHSRLAKRFFHRGKWKYGKTSAYKVLPVNPGICLPMHSTGKYRTSLFVDVGIDRPPHLAPKLRNRAIPLLPVWPSMACSRVSFTLVSLPVNP